MKVRYTIAPHMKEYDKLGEIQPWIPYLMYFHTPNYSSDVVNTDSRGFRVSCKYSERIDVFSLSERQPKCLFVGGSAAFGVGATNDRTTIPAVLNSVTDELWLNFGGRAFGSTQELLLFLFYHQQINNIKKVVIFSGINNLVLYYLSGNYSKEHGAFFFSNRYNQRMNNPLSVKRRALKAVLNPIFGDKIDYARVLKEELLKSIFSNKKQKSPRSPTTDKEDLLYVLRRDILNWKLLTTTLGIELYYVLQPLANWVDKELSKEEKMLFEELDNFPQNHWKVLRNNMGRNQYSWFSGNVRNICQTNGINFFDMNEAMSKKRLDGRWLYVDRAHFTDEGNRVITEILKEEVIDR